MAGDKANVYIKNNGVYLYTAKDGKSLPKLVQKALRRSRALWGDPDSMARIIFSEMIQREVLEPNCAYGISSSMMENDNFIIMIDDRVGKIGFFSEMGAKLLWYDFDEYCDQNNTDLEWGVLLGQDFDSYRDSAPARGARPFEF